MYSRWTGLLYEGAAGGGAELLGSCKLEISLMMTAFSSLNCSSSATAFDQTSTKQQQLTSGQVQVRSSGKGVSQALQAITAPLPTLSPFSLWKSSRNLSSFSLLLASVPAMMGGFIGFATNTCTHARACTPQAREEAVAGRSTQNKCFVHHQPSSMPEVCTLAGTAPCIHAPMLAYSVENNQVGTHKT